jgi:hypothetical protein
MSHTEQIRKFLNALFANKPDEDKILIWARQPDHFKTEHQPRALTISRWAGSVDVAATAVETSNPKWDIYAGVGLSPRAFGSARRCQMKDISGIVGVWIDIDIGEAGHKKKGGAYPNPADIETATELVKKAVPLVPSLTVSTGGGLHVYWLFAEPWLFETPAERDEAIALLRGFQKTFQLLFVAHGYSVDSTHDIARVMRIPGTTNWKLGVENPRACIIGTINEARYQPDDLRQFVSPEAAADAAARSSRPSAAGTPQTGELIVNPSRNPPPQKFFALAENEPKFLASWNRTRRDLKDSSVSGYDGSLSTLAAQAGWTDQEICDLLVASRVKHKDDLKRPEYYRHTITTARATASRATAVEALQYEAAKVNPENPAQPVTGDQRLLRLAKLSDALGTKIVTILKYRQDPPKYRLVTAKGEIELGTVDNLIGQTSLRNALAASDGHYIPLFKGVDWGWIAQSLLNVCEDMEVSPESTDVGQTRAWLEVYLDDNPPSEMSDTAISNQVPYYDPGESESHVYFSLSHFRNWIKTRQDEKLSGRVLGVLLRMIGAKSKGVALGKSTRNVRRVSRTAEPGSNGKHSDAPERVAHPFADEN